MKRTTRSIAGWIVGVGLLLPTFAQAQSPAISAAEAYEIGIEAYIYFYPLVMMDVTRRVTTNAAPGANPMYGPMNTFSHVRRFPDAGFREVVRPNFDTLYSSSWLDLSAGPVVVTAPETNGRYYLLPMIDMWSDVFAVPGQRTSGTGAANFAVVPPQWNGELPAGLQRIESPTTYVWIIGRTQTNGSKDYAAVNAVQDGYRITPLSAWGKTASQPQASVDPTVDMKTPPLVQVNTMPAAKYFAYSAELMKANPPHLTDWSTLARLRKIGIEPGKSFDSTNLPADVQAALDRAAGDGLALMKAKVPTLARVVNGWQMNTDSIGVYGNYYLKRAIVAMAGLGANQPEDAIYPLLLVDADGTPLVGEGRYVVHFEKNQLPPAGAFWSITMYDAEGFPVPNSLDIYLQHENPGPGLESNWLPAPAAGVLGVTMRLYAPRAAALDGRWNPPAVRRVP